MNKDEAKKCKCPNCENELEMHCFEPAFCTPCNISLIECKSCGHTHSDKLDACPKCKQQAEK